MNLTMIPNTPHHLSFSKSLSTSQCHFLPNNNNLLPFSKPARVITTIHMGGGPRTYPGGVSKWQWKRMQAKKAKQLLKARLCRERQIYEMRKRAELKAAVSELERPWEVVEKAPNLFSVSADEQVKVLADRFQKPGGFDMWSEKDGPHLFQTPDELPSARFFPKGVVHSVKPYRKVQLEDLDDDGGDGNGESCSDLDSGLSQKRNEWKFLSEGIGDGSYDDEGNSCYQLKNGRNGVSNDGRMRKNVVDGRKAFSKGIDNDGSESDGEFSSPLKYDSNGENGDGRLRKNITTSRFPPKIVDRNGSGGEGSSTSLSSGRNGVSSEVRLRKKVDGKRFVSKNVDRSNGLYSGRVGSGRHQRGNNSIEGRSRGRKISDYGSQRLRDADTGVYDMGLQQDGSYGFLQQSEQSDSKSW